MIGQLLTGKSLNYNHLAVNWGYPSDEEYKIYPTEKSNWKRNLKGSFTRYNGFTRTKANGFVITHLNRTNSKKINPYTPSNRSQIATKRTTDNLSYRSDKNLY